MHSISFSISKDINGYDEIPRKIVKVSTLFIPSPLTYLFFISMGIILF
jgi:hypothetical protein